MGRLRGDKPHGGQKAKRTRVSKADRTLSLTGFEEVHDSSDPITRAISQTPDPDTDIALKRVRNGLEGNTAAIFDFVLHGREKHSVGGISVFCREELAMSNEEVSEARMEIVEAMHSHGLAMNYPPPASLLKHRRMTSVERLMWLERLRVMYKTVEEAATGENVTRNAINHHCRKLHGVSFPDWIAEANPQHSTNPLQNFGTGCPEVCAS